MSAASLRACVLVAGTLTFALAPATVGAETWSCETIATTLVPQPSLTLDAAGVPYVAFSANQPCVAKRVNGSWVLDALTTPTGKDAPQLDIINFVTPTIAVGETGPSPYVLYSKSPENDIWFAQRESGSWQYERLSTNGGSPDVETDAAGTPHILFLDGALGHRYGVRDGASWTFETAPGYGPLALDFAGRPQILSVAGIDLEWSIRNANGWSTEIVADDGVGQTSLAIDGDGEPHVAFSDNDTQRVRYARRVAGTWTVETVATGIGQWVSTSIALGAGGEPFIAFYDQAAGSLRFARRVNGAWTHELVEATGTPANDLCSLAIDGAGRPHIAYFNTPARLLRYATTSAPVAGVQPVAALDFGIASLGPNPARSGGALDLALRLDAPRTVTLELLDLAGRRVASREPVALAAGTQHVSWAPRVNAGGLYFLAVRSNRGERLTTRLALVP